MVVRAEDGLGCARGGDDEGGDGAEAEEHEVGAVLPCEVAEGDVGEGADEVQVTDHRQTWRGRRRMLVISCGCCGQVVA